MKRIHRTNRTNESTRTSLTILCHLKSISHRKFAIFHSTPQIPTFAQHTVMMVTVTMVVGGKTFRHHIFGCTHTAHILARYQQHPSIAIAFAMPIFVIFTGLLSISLPLYLFLSRFLIRSLTLTHSPHQLQFQNIYKHTR